MHTSHAAPFVEQSVKNKRTKNKGTAQEHVAVSSISNDRSGNGGKKFHPCQFCSRPRKCSHTFFRVLDCVGLLLGFVDVRENIQGNESGNFKGV